MDVSLNCKMTALVAGVSAKKGEHHNFVKTKFDVKIENDKAKELFGSDFYKLAFGSLVFDHDDDGTEVPVFGYHSLVLKQALGGHTLKAFGYEHIVEPVLESVTPAKGERAVWLTISAIFIANESNRDFNGALFQKFNTNVDLDFNPRQGELFGAGAAADDDDDDDDDAPARVPGRGKKAAASMVVNATGAFGNPRPTVVSG